MERLFDEARFSTLAEDVRRGDERAIDFLVSTVAKLARRHDEDVAAVEHMAAVTRES